MAFAMHEALAAFRRTPLLTLLSAGMIGLSLFVMGLFGMAAHNIRAVIDEVEARVEVVAYLRDDAPPDAVRLARTEVEAYPEVASLRYVSREDALAHARETLPEFRTVFSDFDDINPLPASFEIQLRPEQRSAENVRAVADRVAAYPFVEEVRFGEEWLDRVFLLRRIAGAAALVLGAAFSTVAALIIGAAVRMAMYARREEIAIMSLVGATRSFIRRPFLLEGLFTGLLGGVLAFSLTYAVYRAMIGAEFDLHWMPNLWAWGGIAAGGILGLLASAAAVNRYLESS